MVERNVGRAIVCVEGRCPNEKLSKMPPGRARWTAAERSDLLGWLKAEFLKGGEAP